MTVPQHYVDASVEFTRFLIELRDLAQLSTTNQAYTIAEGVLLAFRRHLDVADVARFATVLPPVLRAIFVADWDPSEPPAPFGNPAELTQEVQSLRPLHNYAGETSIGDVARALRRHVDAARFARVLDTLPPEAAAFWATQP